jgi:hypothetical protein
MTTPVAALPRFPALPERISELVPVIPALVVLIATATLQIGQTPDSVQYLRAAEQLARHGEFGADFVYWPPLYSALLALHPGAPWPAVLAQLGAFATILGFWAVGRTVIESRIGLTFALLALACLPQFGTVFGSVWSETVYVPLCVWLAYFWARHLTSSSLRSLIASCILLALAMLSRHVGVVLACAMALMACRRPFTLAMIGAACIPYALWVARTFIASGTYAGHRAPLAHPDLSHQLELFGRVVGHWFVPHVFFLSGGILIGCAFQLLAITALAYHARRSPLLTFAALFVLGHGALTIYTASRVSLDVDPRTLFPIFWPTLLLVVCGIEAIGRRVAGRWFAVFVVAYGLFWFAAPNAIVNALV